jgi:hypothetical protein
VINPSRAEVASVRAKRREKPASPSPIPDGSSTDAGALDPFGSSADDPILDEFAS